jgi:threonyl-tRNA synthetase
MQRLPYLLVIGDKEVASNLVAVRTRKGEDLGQMPLEALLERLSKDLADKGSAA